MTSSVDPLEPHVVKWLIEPSEVADAERFLTTPAGRTITGAPLVMDQGWTARQFIEAACASRSAARSVWPSALGGPSR